MLISILCILFSTILWRIGGMGYKPARAIGVPLLITVSKFILVGFDWYALLYFGALWLMLAGFSYGLTAPPHKFWVWMFGKGQYGDVWYVELATRLTCGLFWCLSAIIFAFISANWLNFGLYMVLGTICIGVMGLVKNDYVSELGIGTVVAIAVMV